MAKAWSEVEASPDYKSLSPDEQQGAKVEYFSTVVEPKEEFKALKPEEQTLAKNEFIGETKDAPIVNLTEEEKNIKEPFPYLNFVPGGKQLNTAIVDGATRFRDSNPAAFHAINKFERIQTLQDTDFNNGLLEGATGGIPRAIIAKMTGVEMDKGTIAGRIVGSFLPTGVLSKTLKAPMIVKNAVEGAIAMNLVEGMPADDFLNLEKRMKTSATGAAFGIITPAIVKAGIGTTKAILSIPKAAVAESEKVMARLMNATHIKDYAFGKNPPGAVIEALGKDLPSSTVGELYEKIQLAIPKYVEKAKALIAQAETDSGKLLNLSEKINKPIDDAINEAVKGGKNNQALVTRLTNLKETLNFEQAMGKRGKIVSTKVPRIMDGIKPSNAVSLKQEIGQLGKWTGIASDDGIVNKTTQKLYGIVRTEIEKVVSGVDKVNETLSGLLSADSLIKRAAVYEHGAPMFKGAGKIVGSAGVLYGLASNNPVMVKESIAVLGLNKIAGSVEAQTKLAYGLSKMGKEAQIDILTRYPKLKPMLDPIMKKFSQSTTVASAIASARMVGNIAKQRVPTLAAGAEKQFNLSGRIGLYRGASEDKT